MSTGIRILTAASAVVASLAVLVHAPSPIRVGVVLWFVLTCPGAACVRLLRPHNGAAAVTLSVVVSIMLAALMSEAMVLTHAWSSTGLVLVLATVTIAAAVVPATAPDVAAGRRP
jgi:hypothetical protein